MGWSREEEEEEGVVVVNVPFTVEVAVSVAVPVVEVEQTGLATRLVRLGQAARAESSCELWAM
jgi:hypothetical protein